MYERNHEQPRLRTDAIAIKFWQLRWHVKQRWTDAIAIKFRQLRWHVKQRWTDTIAI